MNKEMKYCKFCDKEKPIKEFAKSGGFVKNICKECQNKKQRQIYSNSKRVIQLENENLQFKQALNEIREIADKWIYGYENFCIKMNDRILQIIDKIGDE